MAIRQGGSAGSGIATRAMPNGFNVGSQIWRFGDLEFFLKLGGKYAMVQSNITENIETTANFKIGTTMTNRKADEKKTAYGWGEGKMKVWRSILLVVLLEVLLRVFYTDVDQHISTVLPVQKQWNT